MSGTHRTLPSWAVAAVLGGAVFLAAGADLRQHYVMDPGLPLAVSLAWGAVVVAAVLVIGRVVAPVVVVVVAWAVAALAMVAASPSSPSEPWPWSVGATAAVLVVLVALGLRTGSGRRVVLALAWLGTQAVGAVAVVLFGEENQRGWSGLVTPAVLTAVAVVVADLLGTRNADRRARDASRREAEAAVAARRDADERRELAHELHDVVAHHLSVVVVRADSAPARVGGLDDATRAEFAAIGDDARVCLEQLRRVLRVLETGDVAAAPVTPQPGLDDVGALVAGAQSAGADVRFVVDLPDAGDVDPWTGLAAYRVAQEALTNALRHAPGAPVQVSVRDDGGSLVVEVENAAGAGGPVTGRAATGGSGRGLRGMRERVDVVGGRFEAGPTTAGGFRVHAALPRREVRATPVTR